MASKGANLYKCLNTGFPGFGNSFVKLVLSSQFNDSQLEAVLF